MLMTVIGRDDLFSKMMQAMALLSKGVFRYSCIFGKAMQQFLSNVIFSFFLEEYRVIVFKTAPNMPVTHPIMAMMKVTIPMKISLSETEN